MIDDQIKQMRRSELGYYLLARAREDGDCLLFRGATSGDGYACLQHLEHDRGQVHRLLWKELRGNIRGRLMNLCGHRQCMNLEHWRDATPGQILSRAFKSGARGSRKQVSATAKRADDCRSGTTG